MIMADYILLRKSRNVISSFLHILLNTLLGVGSVLITFVTDSWYICIFLVIISKWRTFAVHPRYWWVNFKASLVDFIVGVSFVFIAYCSGEEWQLIHTILAILYPIWLIFIKPRSTDFFTEFQAITAVLLGTTASVMLFASSNSIFLAMSCFVIGFAAIRHTLVQSDDSDFSLMTVATGLFSAEIAWLCHSWLIVYTFAGTGIIIPQLAIILSLAFFALNRIYASAIRHDGEIRLSEITLPTVFSVLTILIIVLFFSKPIFDIYI